MDSTKKPRSFAPLGVRALLLGLALWLSAIGILLIVLNSIAGNPVDPVIVEDVQRSSFKLAEWLTWVTTGITLK